MPACAVNSNCQLGWILIICTVPSKISSMTGIEMSLRISPSAAPRSGAC